MSQRTLLATIVGALVLFVLGFLVYGMALADYFAGQGIETLDEPILWAIFLGELAMAALLTFIFVQWASISTFAGGFKGGAIVGGLVTIAFGMIQIGAMGANFAPIVVDLVISVVRVGLAGGAIGAMLGRK
ncbi:MAG: hypothetical protein AAF604_16810 [Acidobacteriota bacterium]